MNMGLFDFAKSVFQPSMKAAPPQKDEAKGGLFNYMVTGFGNQGVSKEKALRTDVFDYRLTAKMRYTLRKRHAYTAAVIGALIKQCKKAEIEVIPRTPDYTLKPAEEAAKKKMEEFLAIGFGPRGEKEFRGRMIDTKKWYGDAFAEIVFDSSDGQPLLVNYLIAETMRVNPSANGQILSYPQVVDGKLNTIFPIENVIHLIETPDEYNFFYGYSPLDALYLAILLDAYADENSIARLENDTLLGPVFGFENTSDADLARMRWQFINQIKQQPGKPVFLNGKFQAIPPQLSQRDFDWQELRRTTKEKIMMNFSVLPIQVSVVETGKLANPDQQIEIGEEYVRQELESMQDAYNLKLASKFKDAENLMFHFRDIEPKLDALQKEATIAKTKAEAAALLASIKGAEQGMGAYTVNEIRDITGHSEVENGEEPVAVTSPPTSSFPTGFSSQYLKKATTEIQSLLFDRQKFSRSEAISWAADHGFKHGDVEETEEKWRLRQFDPDRCTPGTYGNRELTDGVQAIFCSVKAADIQSKPFGEYDNFQDCVDKNQDKDNPEAYCAAIMQAIEGSASFEEKAPVMHKSTRAQNRELFINALEKPYAKFSRAAIKLAKEHYPTPPPDKAMLHVHKKLLSGFEIALGALLSGLMDNLNGATSKHAKKTYSDAKEALGVSFGEQDTRAIERLLSSGGALDAVKDFSKEQQAGFLKVMKEAFENGLDERKMARAMRNYADVETYRLERIARTETNRFANQGRFAGYDELENRRGEKYEYNWVGPQDERTSEICTDIKMGNPYSLEDIMNVTDGGEPHINCRHNVVRMVR